MAPEPNQNLQMFQTIKKLQLSYVQFKKDNISETPKN